MGIEMTAYSLERIVNELIFTAKNSYFFNLKVKQCCFAVLFAYNQTLFHNFISRANDSSGQLTF